MAKWREKHPKGACEQEQHQVKDFDDMTEGSGRAGELAARATVRRHDAHRPGGRPHKKGKMIDRPGGQP